MASALCILILPEGTELVYVGVLLEMPKAAEGAAVLVHYHLSPVQMCVKFQLWDPPQGQTVCFSTLTPWQVVSLCHSKTSEAMLDRDGGVWLR